MAERPPRQSSGILSRDLDGTEHLLRIVDHPAGFVIISDDIMVRMLTPIAAAALVMHLLHAIGSYLPVRSEAQSKSYAELVETLLRATKP
jgi:isoprenylcysteine carboxyl methyltransferase (ICMT) family protein YpbQ